jgi:hypothetical protein
MKLSENELNICQYLAYNRDWISPTIIGGSCGPNPNSHSAWASPICLRMVKKGLLKRNKKGWYKLK